jgi:lysophospholipase L1-like esterase
VAAPQARAARVPRASRRARAPVARSVRALIHTAALALVATWIATPERTGPFFGALGGGLAAVSLALALAARTRPRLAAALERTRRGLDLATLAFVATFALAEVELRVLARFVHVPLLAPPDARADELIRAYRLAPGAPARGTVANDQGFLDGPFVAARRPGTKRIVALADSFGVGVVDYRDHFLTRLDDLLDGSAGATAPAPPLDPVEVLNFSVICTSPREYLQLWRTEAVRYDPDLVLLCFFTGNDWGVSRNATLLQSDSTFLVTFVGRLVKLAREKRVAARAVAKSEAASPGAAGELPVLTPESFLRIERDRLEFARRVPRAKTAAQFEETLALFATIAAEIGPKLRVAIVPDEYQVNDTLFAELAGAAAADFDRALPSRRLAGGLAALGVPFLDLLPPLVEAQRDGATYKVRDTHWNERGNLVAAQALAAWLAPQLK